MPPPRGIGKESNMPYPENNELTDGGQLKDDIVKCSDGTYRWIYEMPMRKSFFLLFDVWRVLLIAGIAVMLITMIFSDGTLLERLKDSALTVGIVLGILFVLSLPAYWIVTRANNGKYTVLFELDEKFLSHTQIKTEKAKALELLTMLTGAATGNMTTTGIGLMNSAGGSLTSRLEKVRTVRGNRRKKLIKVNSLIKRNQVYVKDSDYDFVMDFLTEHCPAAKVSR